MSSPESHTPASPPTGPVPAWADVFDDRTTAREFVRVVADVVHQRWSDDAVFDSLLGRVTLPTDCTIDFANTACELIGHDEQYWRSYLFLMLSEYDSFDPAALDRDLRSWSRIRTRLRVRLFPTAAAPPMRDDWDLVRRPVSDSLSFILAADAEIGCVPIPADAAAEWGKPPDQVWRTAIKNMRSRTFTRLAVVQSPSARFLMIEGDLFTTGHARDLEQFFPGIVGPHGALVAAPTSRALFVQPIEDPDRVATDAAGLVVAAATFSSREPNLLTHDLLWYRGVDQLVGALDVESGAGIRVIAPAPLARWLEPR